MKRERSTWRAAARRIVRRALFSFPVTIRISLEFDTADIQQDWWLPWFHSWRTLPGERFSLGCRVGVLGLHLIVGVAWFKDDFRGWDDEGDE